MHTSAAPFAASNPPPIAPHDSADGEVAALLARLAALAAPTGPPPGAGAPRPQ